MTDENGICEAPFLLPLEKVLRVERYSGETVYEQERFFHRTEQESKAALEEKGIRLDFGAGGSNEEFAGAFRKDKGKERGRHCFVWRQYMLRLGFGMNDRCKGKEYGKRVESLIKEIGKDSQKTEFLLIVTTLPNRLADTEPLHFWAYQDDQEESLKALCGKGIALANVQGIQKEMERKKRYLDLTGNLLNHPNDYLARIQA
ncbi:MAG: hypothetical protein HFI97_10965 [Lachnospiraceae bacterium]|jgi:hypothetical protein|nr:hypothetical protein [Lachnospiraceae bacterium]MCI9204211.1 hypothetical protein [Lachnospiraceae bacterium]